MLSWGSYTRPRRIDNVIIGQLYPPTAYRQCYHVAAIHTDGVVRVNINVRELGMIVQKSDNGFKYVSVGENGEVEDKTVAGFMYADDLCLCASSEDGLQRVMDEIASCITEIERKLENKVDLGDVVALINEKSEKDKANQDKEKIVEDQLKEKQIIYLVKQVETKSVADIVRKQLQDSNISEQNVSKLVDDKIDEIDKHITGRQSLEKNVIIFKMEEPNTNLIKERQAKDLEALNEMIEQIAVESDEEIKIDKIIRLGTRGANYKDNPCPAIVSFSTIERLSK